MCKERPVVIVSISPARPDLAIVVPLSTTPPCPPHPWHRKLSDESNWSNQDTWAKCDMIYAMRISRFGLWGLGRDADGKRIYLKNHRITEDDFLSIKAGMRAAIS